jgi:hypothetical protein
MSAQELRLFTEPAWTDAFTVGDRLRNLHTGNLGTVRSIAAGRHLLVAWEQWQSGPWSCRHHSDRGLEVLA